MSKKEGQPGTPEKPLSDLGRVSYHAYWKSVVLEYLHKHKNQSDKIKLTEISKETGMYCHDIALALQLLGFIKYAPTENQTKAIICVDWEKVDSHADRVAKSKTRIHIDPECLRWTPLLTPAVNPFREDRSSNEKEIPETADIVVPVPEKIILETQQGVKMRKGRKRKFSGAPKTPKTPKSELKTPIKETGKDSEEVEVTSSGRKRTRPVKFNETTYADVKLKTPDVAVGKRKRSETNLSDKEVLDQESKKAKGDTSVNSRSKGKVEDNLEQNIRSKRNNKEVSNTKDVETPKVNQSKEVANSRKRSKLPKSEEIKDEPKTEEEAVNKNKASETEEISTTPQLKKKNQKTPKKKRGWVKGKSRRNPSIDSIKQMTIPELFKKDEAKRESETESLLSEKSDDEILKVPTEKAKTKSELKAEEKKKKRLSCEEDSSAEADDEMENDEIVTKKKPITCAKYKYTPNKEKLRVEESRLQISKQQEEDNAKKMPLSESVGETPKKQSPKKESSPEQFKEEPRPKKLTPKKNAIKETNSKREKSNKAKEEKDLSENKNTLAYSTTSESETEIDGHKIKTISHKEIMEMSKRTVITSPMKADSKYPLSDENEIKKEVNPSPEKENEPLDKTVQQYEKYSLNSNGQVQIATENKPIKSEVLSPKDTSFKLCFENSGSQSTTRSDENSSGKLKSKLNFSDDQTRQSTEEQQTKRSVNDQVKVPDQKRVTDFRKSPEREIHQGRFEDIGKSIDLGKVIDPEGNTLKRQTTDLSNTVDQEVADYKICGSNTYTGNSSSQVNSSYQMNNLCQTNSTCLPDTAKNTKYEYGKFNYIFW